MTNLEEKVKKSYFRSFIAKTAKFGLKMLLCCSIAYGIGYYNSGRITERVREYKEKIQEIRKDKQIGYNLYTLLLGGVAPEYASEFFDIKRKDGNPFYKEKDVVRLYKCGVPLEYVKEIHKFEKDTKSFDISDVFPSKSSERDLSSFVDVVNQLRAIQIEMLWKNRVPIDYVKEIISIKNRFDGPVFDFDDIAEFYGAGGTIDYAKKLLEIKNNFGNSILTGKDIAEYKTSDKCFKKFKEDVKKGNTNLPDYLKKSILEYDFKENDVDYLNQMININKDEKGYPRFDVKSICLFRIFGGTVEYAKEIAGIKDKDGKQKFDGQELYRFYQLGLKKADLESFNDTEKPNAVIIYPTKDWNLVFEKTEAIEFFHKVREAYDANIVIASEESQVYKAIEETPNIELLILAGHGSKDSLSLSESDLRLFSSTKDDERYKIDKADSELGRYISRLEKNATIFLLSCSNAEGGKQADNLANYVIRLAEGRKVIACEKPFGFREIEINSLYPFDVSIRKGSKDCTYSNR